MSNFIYLYRKGGELLPSSKDDADKIFKLPENQVLKSQIKMSRNYNRLKRAMALLRLSFQYWEPDSLISSIERNTVQKLADVLVSNGISYDAVVQVCTEYFNHLEKTRGTVEAEKSFESFREFITIKSGFFNIVKTPNGIKKEAKSWAFSNMTEETFIEMYKALFNTCWRIALNKHFKSEDDAENAAINLMNFS